MKNINEIKVGFIGTGHMGKILIDAVTKNIKEENIYLYDKLDTQLVKFKNTNYNISKISDLVKKSDVILLCVNPTSIRPVIDEISEFITSEKILCSIAAGINLDELNTALKDNNVNNSFIRIMPNTPVRVGEGIILASRANDLDDKKINILLDVLSPCGMCMEVSENTLENSIAVFSCSPAYAFMFIDAIAKAGVKIGLDYASSLKLASQAIKGSSQILLDINEDVDSLVKSLCTKGGMTIEGVESLNSDNFYEIVEKAIIKASDKQRKLK